MTGRSEEGRVRQRARERVWTPTEERVEILVALSELIDGPRLGRRRLLEESAAILGEILGDAIAIDVISGDGRWMIPFGVYHPDPAGSRELKGIVDRPFPADEGFSASALEGEAALLIPRVGSAELLAMQPEIAPICEAIGARGFVIVPLMRPGGAVGILWQIRTGLERLVEDDRRFLLEVGSRLTLALTCAED